MKNSLLWRRGRRKENSKGSGVMEALVTGVGWGGGAVKMSAGYRKWRASVWAHMIFAKCGSDGGVSG